MRCDGCWHVCAGSGSTVPAFLAGLPAAVASPWSACNLQMAGSDGAHSSTAHAHTRLGQPSFLAKQEFYDRVNDPSGPSHYYEPSPHHTFVPTAAVMSSSMQGGSLSFYQQPQPQLDLRAAIGGGSGSPGFSVHVATPVCPAPGGLPAGWGGSTQPVNTQAHARSPATHPERLPGSGSCNAGGWSDYGDGWGTAAAAEAILRADTDADREQILLNTTASSQDICFALGRLRGGDPRRICAAINAVNRIFAAKLPPFHIPTSLPQEPSFPAGSKQSPSPLKPPATKPCTQSTSIRAAVVGFRSVRRNIATGYV
jgi:hypothetical protein